MKTTGKAIGRDISRSNLSCKENDEPIYPQNPTVRQFEHAKRKIQKYLARLDKQLTPLLAEKTELKNLLNATQKKINTLQSALQIIAKFEPLDLGKFAHRVFHSKVNQLLAPILKTNPNTAYPVRELAVEILTLDNQPNTILNENTPISLEKRSENCTKKA